MASACSEEAGDDHPLHARAGRRRRRTAAGRRARRGPRRRRSRPPPWSGCRRTWRSSACGRSGPGARRSRGRRCRPGWELRRAQRAAGVGLAGGLGRRPAPVAGGRRGRRSAAGTSRTQARTPMAAIAVRQSWVEISQPANGVIVIGAMPIPAETRLTASARPVVNQPVTAAIIGAKKAPADRPTMRPKPSWKVRGVVRGWRRRGRPRAARRRSAPPAAAPSGR